MAKIAVIESKSPFYAAPTNKISTEANELTTQKSFVEVTENELPRGLDNLEDENGSPINIPIERSPSSAANPYFNVRVKQATGQNYPMTDEESAANTKLYQNITAQDLIAEPRGASIFSVDDFIYAKNFGKIPLNRMVTLRRFAHPVFDDIFSTKSQSEPDISRLIGFTDDENNKLSEILSFSCGLRWKPLTSESESAEMSGNQNGVDGIVGKVLKFVDPKFGRESVRGANSLSIDPQHDQNRVYGPVDSINSAHIRDVGLDFEQQIILTFEYKMQSFNGVNQKAAFIDILSNLLLMCTNDAKFWGGARYWIGVQPSKYMNDMKSLSPKNWEDFVGKASSDMKRLLGSISTKSSAKETLKNIANNALNLALGKILNTLGRPGIPVMNSLLTGNPIGLWHLTVGNPMNPIMCTGDLIMEDAQISFGDELGYDDFPTELKAVITLKHPKARGRAEIESMFNAGKGRTYFKPKNVLNRKNKTTISKAQKNEGKPISTHQTEQAATTSLFGDYDMSAIQRVGPEIWSFLKQSK